MLKVPELSSQPTSNPSDLMSSIMTNRTAIIVLALLTHPIYVNAEPLFLECSVKGQTFDSKFEETLGVKIENGMMDIISEEFPMFGRVEGSDTSFKATKSFTSNKGVKYFFSIEIDRASGRFIAYETAAYPNRKIYNTTGSGPCKKITAEKFANLKAGAHNHQRTKVIIRTP